MLLMFACVLSGCGEQVPPSKHNAVAQADEQRHAVIEKTRAASYSVFPDTDDPKKLEDPTFLDAMHGETARGSAFAVRDDGLVLTNVHVIEGTNYCTGIPDQPKSEDDVARERGREKEEAARREQKKDTHCLFVSQAFTRAYRAKLIKLDQANDIAALCLVGERRTVPFLRIAAAGTFNEGAEVLTIGAPLGNTNFMTPGYISNLEFTMQDKETGKKEAKKLQFTAPILPGNSGGPLVSVASGEVVGQVVAIYTMRGLPTQMSYANPAEYLKRMAQTIPPCAQ